MPDAVDPIASTRVAPVTILIPARNERAAIGPTLRALADQRDLDGSPRDCRDTAVVVLANGCTDDTSSVARTYAEPFGERLHVVDVPLAASPPNIGAIRRSMFDAAARRSLRAGMPRALLVSLDADTVVSPAWIATLLRESANVDAVAGYVTIADPAATCSASFADLYRRFLALGDLLARIESRIDPRPDDPYPRHGAFSAAGFAVTAEAYVRSGGMPAVGQFEDRLFERALLESGARIRHSLDLRSWTSPRRDARVSGGFGTLVSHLQDCADRGTTYRVPDPREAVRDLTIRAERRKLAADRAGRGDGSRVPSQTGIALATRSPGDAAPAPEIPIDEALAVVREILDRMDAET